MRIGKFSQFNDQVFRGKSRGHTSKSSRLATRYTMSPDGSLSNLGFRLVWSVR